MRWAHSFPPHRAHPFPPNTATRRLGAAPAALTIFSHTNKNLKVVGRQIFWSEWLVALCRPCEWAAMGYGGNDDWPCGARIYRSVAGVIVMPSPATHSILTGSNLKAGETVCQGTLKDTTNYLKPPWKTQRTTH